MRRYPIYLFLAHAFIVATMAAQESNLPSVPALPEGDHWIARLNTPSVSLEPFRQARRGGASREELEAILRDVTRRTEEARSAFYRSVIALGGEITEPWWIVNACGIRIPEEQLDRLRAMPEVERLEQPVPLPPATILAHLAQPAVPIDVSATAHGARAVQNGGNFGAGQNLAVVDTGQASPLQGVFPSRPHAIYFQDPINLTGNLLYDNKQIGSQPAAGQNAFHGTAVLAPAAGSDWPGTGAANGAGQAPHAGKVGYSCANDVFGGSNTATIVSAWQQVLTDVPTYGFRAANISYAGTGFLNGLDQVAMDTLAYNGDVVVVAAAGNIDQTPSGRNYALHSLNPAHCVEVVADGLAPGISRFRVGPHVYAPCNYAVGFPWWQQFRYQVGDWVESWNFQNAANNGYWQISSFSNGDMFVFDPGDVLVNEAVNPGNSVAHINHTLWAQLPANGIAVGATTVNRVHASYSMTGPLASASFFRYPDLVAIGDFSILPVWNNENTSAPNSGTSGSSPHVAGAALLVRNADPLQADPARRLTALETRAILLASAEDIRPQNSGLSLPGNQLGAGFLRSDWAVSLAANRSSNVRSAVATNSNYLHRFPIDLTVGLPYRVVVAWELQPPFGTSSWSSFSLQIKSLTGGALGGIAPVPMKTANTYDFTSGMTGRAWIEVSLTGLQAGKTSQEFAVAHTGDRESGTFATYGAGCQGGGTLVSASTVPSAQASTYGNWTFDLENKIEIAEVIAYAQLPTSTITGMYLRQASSGSGYPPLSGGDIEIQIEIGNSSRAPNTVDPTPQANITSPRLTVFPRRWLRLPTIQTSTPTSPEHLVYIPFSTQISPSMFFGNACVLITIYDAQREIAYTLDAVQGSSSVGSAWSINSGAGVAGPNRGLVLVFEHASSLTPAVPRLSLGEWRAFSGVPALARFPAIHRNFVIQLDQALPNAATILFFGLSNTTWGGSPLPLDLGGFGAPGCFVLASGEAQLNGVSNGSGRDARTIHVPNTPSLVGTSFFFQWFVVDPANAFGIVVSNAAHVTIGSTDYAYIY